MIWFNGWNILILLPVFLLSTVPAQSF